MLDDIETQVGQYFEHLELLCSAYSFAEPLQLQFFSQLLADLSPKLKSLHSLYPDKKVRETSSDQLLNFIQSINVFMTNCNHNFLINFTGLLSSLELKNFHVLTNKKVQTDIIEYISKMELPDFDFNFVRFFYSQIIHRWVKSDELFFDSFLTDLQKIYDLKPYFNELYSDAILNNIRSLSLEDVDRQIIPIIDQIEKRTLIIPPSLAEKIKEILIDYITLVHKFRDVLQLQFHLGSLTNDLLTKGLLFTEDFSKICKNQIIVIKDIKKKIDLNPVLFSKYEINEEIYNTKISELEQMIFSNNNMLEYLSQPKKEQLITIDVLSTDEIQFLDLLKNNMSFFVPDIKKIFLEYIDAMLFLLQWWKDTKKSLLSPSQLYELMFESLQETDKIRIVKNIKNNYFKELFVEKKLFFSFIEQVSDDLLPIFSHFTAINTSIFNTLEDITKWDELDKAQPLKNSSSILDATIAFFTRWQDTSLIQAFEEKKKVYESDFTQFYTSFKKIASIYKEIQQERFSKADKALEKIEIITKLINEIEKTVYTLFPTNLEAVKHIDRLKINIETLKFFIISLDKITVEIINTLAKNWDSVSFRTNLNLLNEKIKLLPANKEGIQNPEKLKILVLFNFMTVLLKIEDYLNDSMFSSIMSIDTFSGLITDVLKSRNILLNLQSLIPSSKKETLETFNKNVTQFFDVISVSWLKLAKKTKLFIDNQSKRIPLSDRKTLHGQFIDYKGTSIPFSFKWPIFDNQFVKYDKQFFPKIKSYFYELIVLEDHWQQNITKMNNTKNLESFRKDSIKELESFVSERFDDEFSTKFIEQIDEKLRERVALLKNSTNDTLSIEKMKQFLI